MRVYQRKTVKMILRLHLFAAVFFASFFLLAACGSREPAGPDTSREDSGGTEENRPDTSKETRENTPEDVTDQAEDTPDSPGNSGGKDAAEDGRDEEAQDAPEELPETDFSPDDHKAAEILYSKLRVVDSSYQYVNDYAWDDLYTLLAGVVQTTTGLDHRKPVMSIVRVDPSWDPLLFIGLRENGSETCRFEIYSMDGGYLYRLLSFDDVVYYDPETRFFYLKNAGRKYIYAPHVLLEAAAESNWSSHTRELPVWDLTGFKVSVDHLDPYILDLTRGGGSE